jgi:hypothetical protein
MLSSSALPCRFFIQTSRISLVVQTGNHLFFLKLASRFGLALEILQYSLNIFIDLDWFPKQDLQSFSFSRSAHPSPVTFCLNYGPYSAFAWRQFAPKTIDGDSRLVLDWSRSVWFQPTFYVRASYWRRMGSNERSWHLCRTMVFCSLDTLTLFVLEALASLRFASLARSSISYIFCYCWINLNIRKVVTSPYATFLILKSEIGQLFAEIS